MKKSAHLTAHGQHARLENSMIRKVVIPTAGLGTRLLPATKQQPKEMLPIFTRGIDGNLCVKPLLQVVFENLYDAGFRQFFFVTGRSKRSIEDHFTIDNNFVQYLKSRNNNGSALELNCFYEKIRASNVVFLNQPEAKGFGDAVYHSKFSIGQEPFLVHAGDDFIFSPGNKYISTLTRVFEDKGAAAVFCVEKVRDPRKYGVMMGERVSERLYVVKEVAEKPLVPRSNLAIVAVYAFTSMIYEALEETEPDANDEVQLTNAIQRLLDQRYPIYALELGSMERRVDIGTPLSYMKALKIMSKYATTTRAKTRTKQDETDLK